MLGEGGKWLGLIIIVLLVVSAVFSAVREPHRDLEKTIVTEQRARAVQELELERALERERLRLDRLPIDAEE